MVDDMCSLKRGSIGSAWGFLRGIRTGGTLFEQQANVCR